MSKTVLLINGQGRKRKKPELLTFRQGTEEDVRQFHKGQRVWFRANDGTAKQVTITSQLRTWQKPSPTRHYTMEIAIKFGMWEHDHWRNCDKFTSGSVCDNDAFSRFLIPVEE